MTAVMGAALVAAPVAKANTIELQIADSGGDYIGQGSINYSTPGEATYQGSLDGWSFTIISAATAPAAGTLASPYMDLNMSINSKGSGSLVLTFSGQNYTLAGSSTLNSGSTSLTGTFQAYGGSSDNLNDESQALLGTALNLGSYQSVAGGSISSTDYSLTEVVTVTGGTPGSTDEILSVPDGGMTLTMLGTALVGLAAVRSKFGKH